MLAAAKDFVLGAVRATPPAVPLAVAAAVRSYEISPYRWTHHICNTSHTRQAYVNISESYVRQGMPK